MLVQHILNGKSGDILTITPGASVKDAAAILSERRIGALLVSESDGDLSGIISERDIVRELGKRGSGCLTDEVRDVMTSKVETCLASEPADAVLERMTAGRFRHMPVMQDSRIIGVISIGDVVKARIEMIESENSALTEMIKGF